MAGKFGPGRGELKFRLVVGILGLGMTFFALWRHGIAGMASAEIGLIATAFFGGTAGFAARDLLRLHRRERHRE
jgi:predicted anti-sigma-YlaC factor YlaD